MVSARPPVDEGPGEHDSRFFDDDVEETIGCARCGKPIWAYSERCPECGVHFHGEAWEFKPAGEKGRLGGRRGRWRQWFVTAVVGLLLLSWLLWGVF